MGYSNEQRLHCLPAATIKRMQTPNATEWFILG